MMKLRLTSSTYNIPDIRYKIISLFQMKRKSPTKKAALTPYPSVHPSVLQTAGPLARVKQHLGGSRLLVDLIYDQSEHKVRIPGKMMGGKQGWINVGDLVLLSSWDGGDVTYVYTYEQEKELSGKGFLDIKKNKY